MANIQVKKGGTTMTIKDDPETIAIWTNAGWTKVGGASSGTPLNAPASDYKSTDQVKLQRGSDIMNVMGSDVSYWQGQGWSPVGTTNGTSNTLQGGQQQEQTKPEVKIQTTDSEINSLYQKYFNRNATSNELSNWKNESSSVLDSFLQKEYQNASGHGYDESPIPPGGTRSNKDLDLTNYSDLPDEIKNSEVWLNGSDYDRKMLYLTFKTRGIDDPQIQQDMLKNINEAMSSLDPYYKMQLRLATDDIERSVNKLTGDYTSSLKSYQDKIDQIKEYLIFNKDQLSFNQQQEMASQLKDYQTKLYATRQSMAESGLAFSSPRDVAEENLRTEQQGISQGTAKKYEASFREQELNALRERQALNQNITDLERQQKEGLTKISREGETYLGSANVPTISGVSTLGGIQGTMEAERQAKALNLSNTIGDYYSPNI